MVEEKSPRLERAENGSEIHREMRESDVLDHPDAGDLVVAIALGKGAVIANCHVTPIGKSRFFDSLPGQRRLVLAQRDACRVDAVALGGVHDESAPSAADV